MSLEVTDIHITVPFSRVDVYDFSCPNEVSLSDETYSWLVDNGGMWSVITGPLDDHFVFVFKDADAATLFKLAWGGA
jgi:hypothetical protein